MVLRLCVLGTAPRDSHSCTPARLSVRTLQLGCPTLTLMLHQEYEVRRYAPFVVAEAPMGSGSCECRRVADRQLVCSGGSMHTTRLLTTAPPPCAPPPPLPHTLTAPAGGAGFNELAGYIFGNNSERTTMEMTVPVFSQARSTSGTGSSGSSMQFVIEKKMGGEARSAQGVTRLGQGAATTRGACVRVPATDALASPSPPRPYTTHRRRLAPHSLGRARHQQAAGGRAHGCAALRGPPAAL